MNDFAVITAKDEETTIAELVRVLVGTGFRVIVIDDGSTDATWSEARHAGATVICHLASKGIGPSLLEAWRTALDMGADRVVQIDAGGSHNPMKAWYMVRELGDCDMVIGSRFCKHGQYIGRKSRAIASKFAAAALNFCSPKHKHSDWTSGYRAFSRAALEKLLAKTYLEKMHAWQIEVLRQAIKLKLNVREYPITYTAGRSSLTWKMIDGAIAQWIYLFFD